MVTKLNLPNGLTSNQTHILTVKTTKLSKSEKLAELKERKLRLDETLMNYKNRRLNAGALSDFAKLTIETYISYLLTKLVKVQEQISRLETV